MTLEGYSRTWWDERTTAVSAVVDLVNSKNNTQQQKESCDRRMLFEPESVSFAIGAPSGAPAPKVVHAQPAESIVND
jgi:hypothetical protein